MLDTPLYDNYIRPQNCRVNVSSGNPLYLRTFRAVWIAARALSHNDFVFFGQFLSHSNDSSFGAADPVIREAERVAGIRSRGGCVIKHYCFSSYHVRKGPIRNPFCSTAKIYLRNDWASLEADLGSSGLSTVGAH